LCPEACGNCGDGGGDNAGGDNAGGDNAGETCENDASWLSKKGTTCADIAAAKKNKQGDLCKQVDDDGEKGGQKCPKACGNCGKGGGDNAGGDNAGGDNAGGDNAGGDNAGGDNAGETCENDASWKSKVGTTCAVIQADADKKQELCQQMSVDDDERGGQKCPKACGHCSDGGGDNAGETCENDASWVSKVGTTCANIQADADKKQELCQQMNVDDERGGQKCPKACDHCSGGGGNRPGDGGGGGDDADGGDDAGGGSTTTTSGPGDDAGANAPTPAPMVQQCERDASFKSGQGTTCADIACETDPSERRELCRQSKAGVDGYDKCQSCGRCTPVGDGEPACDSGESTEDGETCADKPTQTECKSDAGCKWKKGKCEDESAGGDDGETTTTSSGETTTTSSGGDDGESTECETLDKAACKSKENKKRCKYDASKDKCEDKSSGGDDGEPTTKCKKLDEAACKSKENKKRCKYDAKKNKCKDKKDKSPGGGSCKDNTSEDSCKSDALGCKWKKDKCKSKGGQGGDVGCVGCPDGETCAGKPTKTECKSDAGCKWKKDTVTCEDKATGGDAGESTTKCKKLDKAACKSKANKKRCKYSASKDKCKDKKDKK